MMRAIDVIGRHNLTKIVYTHVLEQICLGAMLAGEPIIEQQLSDLLGVSRTPVREALKQLEQEGLVVHYPAKGVFVKEITAQDIEEIYHLRMLFEVAAIERAALRIPDEELRRLKKMCLKLHGEGDVQAFYQADRDFHAMFIRYAKNARLAKFYGILGAQIECTRRASATVSGRVQASRGEHLAIIEAIESRDILLCRERMAAHIDNVRRGALKAHGEWAAEEGSPSQAAYGLP